MFLRPHLFYTLRAYRRRTGEPKGFTWQDYRDLIIAPTAACPPPLTWCWDNLNIHLAPELAEFAAENKEWLRIYRLPAYAPDLNPPRASGRCSSRPWPTSQPPMLTAWCASSSAS